MIKTYTEQWREGTLPKGLYYTRSSNGRKVFSIHTGSKSNMFSPYDKMAHQVEEVLGPVPDYMDCKGLIYDSINLADARKRIDELVSKTEQLEKKLEIATKALNNVYHDMKCWTFISKRDRRVLSVISEALKEMEGVK